MSSLPEHIKFKSRSRSTDRFWSESRRDAEGIGLFEHTINTCDTIISGAKATTSRFQDNPEFPLGEIEPDVEHTWYMFGRAAASAVEVLDWQRLVALLAQIRSLGVLSQEKDKQEEIARMPDGRLWLDLPGFQQMMEQMLRAAFQIQFSDSPDSTTLYWTNLNHVLVRVSVAGIYDLRICCLWVLRDVLEDPVQVKREMLDILIVWLLAYGLWIERLVMAKQVKPESDTSWRFTDGADGTVLHVGDLIKDNEILPAVDQDRCRFWRRRLEKVMSSSEELREAAQRVLQMLPAVA